MSHRRQLKNERGQSMVEFAFVLPLLLMLLIAIVEIGMAYNQYLRLTDATRVGARKAATSRLVGDKGAQAKAAVYAAADLDPSKMTVSVTSSDPTWSHAGSDVTVSAAYKYSLRLFGMPLKEGWIHSTTVNRLD
jgi:Flp pilus assembly protein TadG